MTKAAEQQRSGQIPDHLMMRFLLPGSMILLVAFYVFLALIGTTPPRPAPATTAETEFSSERALKHLTAIAGQPHPLGTSEHDQVRDYLLGELAAMGTAPEIQRTTITDSSRFTPVVGATIENVIGILKGSNSGKAIMLVSHYDSAVNSPGASDDGCAVAAMLECLRALKSSPPLKNDVIFLFTDGEEAGLFGAKAFADENPLASNVGVALNFEARGSRGPSIMFETSPDNGRLITEFAKASPHPVANSLSYFIYKLLPNDTDLSAFKRSGLAGLNLAYIGGASHYHSSTDDLAAVDQRSLQHHGTYAVALARHFGSIDLDALKEPDATYFDLLGSVLIHYSKPYEKILMMLTFLAGLAATVIGFKKKRLTLRGVMVGAAALLANLTVVAIVIKMIWQVIRVSQGWDGLVAYAVTDRLGYYMAGFVALTVAISASLYILLLKKFTAESLATGAALWWLLLAILASLFQPTISYIFVLPLLPVFGGMIYLLSSTSQSPSPPKRFIALAAMALLAVVLICPMAYLTSLAVGEVSPWVPMALVVLLTGLLIPQLELIGQLHKLLVPAVAVFACLCFVFVAMRGPDFGTDNPKPNHLFYGLDADKQKAIWASADRRPDEWTSQFISPDARRDSLQEFFPAHFLTFLTSDAPVTQLAPPDLKVLEDTLTGGIRRLHLRISSSRQAPVLMLRANSPMEIQAVSIAGKPVRLRSTPVSLTADAPWLLRYYALPKEGLDISLEIKSSEAIRLRVIDQSYGIKQLQDSTYRPRPDYMMPASLLDGDSSFVGKSFTF